MFYDGSKYDIDNLYRTMEENEFDSFSFYSDKNETLSYTEQIDEVPNVLYLLLLCEIDYGYSREKLVFALLPVTKVDNPSVAAVKWITKALTSNEPIQSYKLKKKI